jgi:hypothetical protein
MQALFFFFFFNSAPVCNIMLLHVLHLLAIGIGGPVSHGSHPALKGVAPSATGKTQKELLDEGHLPHNIISRKKNTYFLPPPH